MMRPRLFSYSLAKLIIFSFQSFLANISFAANLSLRKSRMQKNCLRCSSSNSGGHLWPRYWSAYTVPLRCLKCSGTAFDISPPDSVGSGDGILCLKSSCDVVPAKPAPAPFGANFRTEAGVLVTSAGSTGANGIVRLGLGVVVVRNRSLTMVPADGAGAVVTRLDPCELRCGVARCIGTSEDRNLLAAGVVEL